MDQGFASQLEEILSEEEINEIIEIPLNDLWTSNKNRNEIIGRVNSEERRLIEKHAYHMRRSHYILADLVVTEYAYSADLKKSMLKEANRLQAIADLLRKWIVFSIQERLGLWEQSKQIDIGFTNDFDILVFYDEYQCY